MASNKILTLKHIVNKEERLKDLKSLLISLSALKDDVNKVLKRIDDEYVSSRLLYDNDKPVGMYLLNPTRAPNGGPRAIYIHNFIVTRLEPLDKIDSYREFMLNAIIEKAKEMNLTQIVLDLKEQFNENKDLFFKKCLQEPYTKYQIMLYDDIKKTEVATKVIVNNNDDESSSRKRRREEEPANVDNDYNNNKKIKNEQNTNKKPIQVTLKKIYVHQIQNGVKTVEGRINSGMFKNMKIGDKIRFFYFQNQSDDATCTITDIKKYKNFENMLNNEDYRKCIPDAYDLKSAINAYDAIPGYKERAESAGVLALHIKLENRRYN